MASRFESGRGYSVKGSTPLVAVGSSLGRVGQAGVLWLALSSVGWGRDGARSLARAGASAAAGASSARSMQTERVAPPSATASAETPPPQHSFCQAVLARHAAELHTISDEEVQ